MSSTNYLDIHGVMARYSIKRRTVWDWIARGILPAPVKFAVNVSRWRLVDLERYDAEREQAA